MERRTGEAGPEASLEDRQREGALMAGLLGPFAPLGTVPVGLAGAGYEGVKWLGQETGLGEYLPGPFKQDETTSPADFGNVLALMKGYTEQAVPKYADGGITSQQPGMVQWYDEPTEEEIPGFYLPGYGLVPADVVNEPDPTPKPGPRIKAPLTAWEEFLGAQEMSERMRRKNIGAFTEAEQQFAAEGGPVFAAMEAAGAALAPHEEFLYRELIDAGVPEGVAIGAMFLTPDPSDLLKAAKAGKWSKAEKAWAEGMAARYGKAEDPLRNVVPGRREEVIEKIYQGQGQKYIESDVIEEALVRQAGMDYNTFKAQPREKQMEIIQDLQDPAALRDVVPELKRTGEIPPSIPISKSAEVDTAVKQKVIDKRMQGFQEGAQRLEGSIQPKSQFDALLARAHKAGGVKVRATPIGEGATLGQHWSGRGLGDPSQVWWSGLASDSVFSSNTPTHELVHHLWRFIDPDSKKTFTQLVGDVENTQHIRLNLGNYKGKNASAQANELLAFTVAEILSPGSNISAGPKTVAHVLNMMGNPQLYDDVMKRKVIDYYDTSMRKFMKDPYEISGLQSEKGVPDDFLKELGVPEAAKVKPTDPVEEYALDVLDKQRRPFIDEPIRSPEDQKLADQLAREGLERQHEDIVGKMDESTLKEMEKYSAKDPDVDMPAPEEPKQTKWDDFEDDEAVVKGLPGIWNDPKKSTKLFMDNLSPEVFEMTVLQGKMTIPEYIEKFKWQPMSAHAKRMVELELERLVKGLQ
jgi:hypothetical protein